ncbi:MAG: winged helix-turn-helix transcriptional regulator [Candidatus Thorarchaeota archaeon]
MDQLDKNIISQLMGCSRKSFRSIADSLGISCPTVKKRVERLRQFGVIQRFSVEMAQETLGTRYVIAELATDGAGQKAEFLQKFDEHECIREVLTLSNGHYLLFAEVTPNEKAQCKEFLESLPDLESSRVSYINQIPSETVGGQCKFAKKGEKVDLTKEELELLWYLVRNSRVPIKTLSRQTGYTIKQVRRIVGQILQNPGIHFTTHLNLVASGDINIVLAADCEDISTPAKIALHLSKRFPQEHWFSMNTIDRNTLYSYMTTKHLAQVEQIMESTQTYPNVYNVDAKIVYSVLKSEGRSEQFINDFAADQLRLITRNNRKRFSGL